jgi:DNA-binding MurR/RpiR family transcriptional regulator
MRGKSMISIRLDRLNSLEVEIHETITKESNAHDKLTITKAAHLCGCSVSKISKFTKKLGFKNYKQYINYIYGNELPRDETSSELDRIRDFLDAFDPKLVDQFIELIEGYSKIILFGYGPSYICAQYFEYKLRIATTKTVITAPDELSIERAMDDESLLVIFTTTGNFESFDYIYTKAKENNCETLFILEEYNLKMLESYDNVFFLTNTFQPAQLLPYEKSRTVFFIFIAEVIQRLLNSKTED